MNTQLPPDVIDNIVKQIRDNSPYKIPAKLQSYIDSENIADELDDDLLNKIGSFVVKATQDDLESREEWITKMNIAIKLVKQINDQKSWPWPKAANVKYPVLLEACTQFNARTNPEFVKDNRVVKIEVIVPDKDGVLTEKSEHLSAHMSYQLLVMNDHWQTDQDKLTMILPLLGSVFKKSYWDLFNQIPDSELCLPDDIIINNQAASLKKAKRITHRLYLDDNQLLEFMRMGLFTKIDIDTLVSSDQNELKENRISGNDDESDTTYSEISKDDSRMHICYEQHTFWDLDNDGYKEPYIITVHEKTKKVLRIVARYNEKSFVFNEKTKEFVRIIPKQYFTHYLFLPSPDGSFYGFGYGITLLPLNVTINTIINQLLDAGTLSNLSCGFIGNNIRLKKQTLDFKPGEWKMVDSGGQSLKDNIVALPVSQPSSVLFQLLELLINAAKEISSVSDIMQGQVPAPNTPATTVVNLIDQSTKVFSSMMTRLYISMQSEFQKLFELNQENLVTSQYYKDAVKSGLIDPNDYNSDTFGIVPVANPALATEAQRIAQDQMLWNLMGWPRINQEEIVRRKLTMFQVPNIEKLIMPPSPPPPPTPDDQKNLAQTALIQMQTTDILNQRTLDALKLHLEELRVDIENRRLKIESQNVGAQIAASKINSIANISKVHLIDPNLNNDIKTEENISNLTHQQMVSDPYGVDIQNQLTQMEGSALQSEQNAQPSGTTGQFQQMQQLPPQSQGMMQQPQSPMPQQQMEQNQMPEDMPPSDDELMQQMIQEQGMKK